MKIAIVNLITRTSVIRNKAPVVISNADAMIVKFASQLASDGCEVELFVADMYKAIVTEKLSVTIHYLRTLLRNVFWTSSIPFTPCLIWALDNDYDFVICSEAFQWSTVLVVLGKLFKRKKFKIVIWQELARHQRLGSRLPSLIFYRVILRFLLDNFISLYVPRSEAARKFLLNQGFELTKVSKPVSHGIDPNVFYVENKSKKEAILFVPALLIKSKGLDVMLKAFAIFHMELPDFKLVIQGDGPLKSKLEALSRQLVIDGHVNFCCERCTHEEMRIKYQKAMLTVIPSLKDNVIFSDMESIACGTPVVISSGVDSHDKFIDNKGGVVFENGNYRQLAAKLICILRNRDVLCEMNKDAYFKSKSFWNSRVSDKIIELLTGINKTL